MPPRTRDHTAANDDQDDQGQAPEPAASAASTAADDTPLTHEQAVDAAAVPAEKPGDGRLSAIDLSSWTDEDIAAALASRGLSTDGDRAAVAARLEQAAVPPADATR